MSGHWLDLAAVDSLLLQAVGVDEVGRGPLAGPVVAAAVSWNPRLEALDIDDSKVIGALRREYLVRRIRELDVHYAIGMASVREIDRLNILNASHLAMRRACAGLRCDTSCVLVDGQPSAAIARTGPRTRQGRCAGADDRRGVDFGEGGAGRHNDGSRRAVSRSMDLSNTKGYGTQGAPGGARELGPCDAHRRSFAPVRNHMSDDAQEVLR